MRKEEPRLKITFVGAGRVGSTTAFSVLLKGLADEIVIIDLNKELAEGEALDLLHATPFVKKTSIRSEDYAAMDGSDFVVISAGAAQKPGESRLDLAERNAGIISGISEKISKYAPESLVLVLTNPVDVLSHVAWKATGFSSERVMGSGTVLDTARLRTLIAANCDVSPSSVHIYIIGEHGDSELAVWSGAMIGGVRLQNFCEFCERKSCGGLLKGFFEKTKRAAYEIISKKGSTNYAIAAAAANIIESSAKNEKRVLTVSTPVDGVYVGYPSVVGRKGVEKLVNIKLSDDETTEFENSKAILRSYMDRILK